MPPFRDEHILIIAPGSRTTLAQLGLPESFTPPRMRIPSRMFPCQQPGTYSFHKIREAKPEEKEEAAKSGAPGEDADDDDEEEEGEEGEEGEVKAEGQGEKKEGEGEEKKDGEGEKAEEGKAAENKEGEKAGEKEGSDEMEVDTEEGSTQWVEDLEDETGAVWMMEQGRVTNWRAFFAMLQYIHETLNPTFHTPILLVHPPTFTREDKELITQFIFEKLKAPGLALLDAALAAMWAYGNQTATVIDVGYEKTDITPIADFIIQERARRTVYGVGGETMTKHLQSLLPDMKPEWVETLKKSPVCEILPAGMPLPGSGEKPVGAVAGGEEDEDVNMLGEDEGTINVAAIVASGKTKEFLEAKEKQKRGEAERKLPNRERETNYFWVVDEKKPGEDDIAPAPSTLTSPVTTKAPELPAPTDPSAPAPTEGKPPAAEDPTQQPPAATSTSPTTTFAPIDLEKAHRDSERRKQTRLAESQGIHLKPTEIWREVPVGTERFLAADCGILSTLADEIYFSIQRVEEPNVRAVLWENLIILGNGSKIRGFRDALLHTLTQKYLIPPSNGTIFQGSIGSGASTPGPGAPGTPGPGGPNPLLVQATTGGLGGYAGGGHGQGVQTPQKVGTVKVPEYFPEWKDVGFEEAGFLGAQVAAKVVFVVDQGANRGFLWRTEYNEIGPEVVHEITW